MKWFKPNKEHINWQEIANNLTAMVANGYEHNIIIGTDSQPCNGYTVFVVAICILSQDKTLDRTFYYGKLKLNKNYAFYDRISFEAQTSVNVANTLREYSSTLTNKMNIAIHLDVSSTEAKTKTSKYSNGLVSLVKAYDYPDVEVKPNSWAASCIADKYTKGVKKNNELS